MGKVLMGKVLMGKVLNFWAGSRVLVFRVLALGFWL